MSDRINVVGVSQGFVGGTYHKRLASKDGPGATCVMCKMNAFLLEIYTLNFDIDWIFFMVEE